MSKSEFETPKIELKPQHDGDPDEFINFGEISRHYLGTQAQYGSHYIEGWEERGYPNLGEGLSFQGDPVDYHSVSIRRGDVVTFIERFLQYRQENSGSN